MKDVYYMIRATQDKYELHVVKAHGALSIFKIFLSQDTGVN